MHSEIGGFTISPLADILAALQKINSNKKGFLIVIDGNGVVQGTLTDGDIRRAFIAGKSVSDCILPIYSKKYKYLNETDSVAEAIDLFKKSKITFLPVIDGNRMLVNIITKSQLHSLLLQDIHADLNYDFLSLDEDIIDYEIFRRPWGFYKTTVYNNYFQSKIISVMPGERLSLQSHTHREEYWIVVHGTGVAQIGESKIEIKCGSSLFIPKGCKHRLSNTSMTDSLIITEVQLGEYLGEDDIIRYEDIYGRD